MDSKDNREQAWQAFKTDALKIILCGMLAFFLLLVFIKETDDTVGYPELFLIFLLPWLTLLLGIGSIGILAAVVFIVGLAWAWLWKKDKEEKEPLIEKKTMNMTMRAWGWLWKKDKEEMEPLIEKKTKKKSDYDIV